MAILSSFAPPWSRCPALAVFAALAIGCANEPSDEASEETAPLSVVAPSVVVADPQTTQASEVYEDRIRLPRAVAGRYRSLPTGSIFVGARGDAESKNPDGFLRRVTSVSDDADFVVIATTKASIGDAILNGNIRTSNGGQTIDDHGAVETASRTPDASRGFRGIRLDLPPESIFDGVDEIDIGGTKTRFLESVRIDGGTFVSKPVVGVDLRIRDGKVERFASKIEGNLETSLHTTATVIAEGDVNEHVLAALRSRRHVTDRVLYRSPQLPLATVDVGGVPISASAQFSVTLHCEIAFGGPLVAHSGLEANSYVRLGGSYDRVSGWTPIAASEFVIKPSLSLDRASEVQAVCAIRADASLSAYGDSGITMSVAPYVAFAVEGNETPTPTFRYRSEGGARGSMRGDARVFGLLPENLDRELGTWTASIEGDAR